MQKVLLPAITSPDAADHQPNNDTPNNGERDDDADYHLGLQPAILPGIARSRSRFTFACSFSLRLCARVVFSHPLSGDIFHLKNPATVRMTGASAYELSGVKYTSTLCKKNGVHVVDLGESSRMSVRSRTSVP